MLSALVAIAAACSDGNGAVAAIRDVGVESGAPTNAGVDAGVDAQPADTVYGDKAGTGSVLVAYPLFGVDHRWMAGFVKSRGPDPSVFRRIGDCNVTTSEVDDAGKSMTGDIVRSSAGPISFTGGTPPFNLVMQPDANALYVGFDTHTKQSFFGGEEDVHFVGVGAEVPAFDVKMTFPLVLRLTDPAFPDGGTLHPPRDADFNFSWTRGAPGIDMAVTIYSDPASRTSTTYVECRIPSEAGHGVIPKEVLGLIEPNSLVFVYTWAYQRVRIGDFDTEIGILTSVHFPPPGNYGVEIRFD